MAIRDDSLFHWHNCGSLVCHDGVQRDIFIYCNDAPGSAYEDEGFGVLLTAQDDSEPEEAPAAVERLKLPAAVIARLRKAGVFTSDEQRVFAANIQAMSRINADEQESASAADRLFDEVLAEWMGGWLRIGSRSGVSVCGGFSTEIFAKKDDEGAAWTVLERSSDGNHSCTIKDDGSGRTIFEQFMAEYYSDEVTDHEAS